MVAAAVEVRNLGRIFHLGGERAGDRTLGGLVTRGIRQGFRRLLGRGTPVDPGEFRALDDVSFDVPTGAVFGIIGRNGSGKSTLLKILSRVLSPTSGEAVVRGRMSSLLEVGAGFHPELTGRENIYLKGCVLGMTAAEVRSRFDDIVGFSGIGGFLDTPVKHYSSGMHARLGFAVAAHLETEVLVADEVLAVGDAEFQRKCLAKADEMGKRGRTVLMVTHDMSAVLRHCTHAVWLEKGRVAGLGPTGQVVSEYMKRNEVPLGEAELDPSEGRNGAAFLRVRITDEDGRTLRQIRHEQAFRVEMTIRVDRPVAGLRMGIRMMNSRGVMALRSSTADMRRPILEGMYGMLRGEFRMPAGLLAPGRYFVSLGCWSPAFGVHEDREQVVSLDVSGSFPTSSDEVLRPAEGWMIGNTAEPAVRPDGLK